MMHHQCNSGSVGGQCSCGMTYHCGGTQSSIFFNSDPPPLDHHSSYNYSSNYQTPNYYNSCPSPSSSVDCTLSLGTPSTRLTDDHHHHRTSSSNNQPRRSSGNYVSNFCWDILKAGSSSSSTKSASRHSNTTTNNMNNDPTLLARRCANCDTTSTPLWRNGPRGPKSLCNACGIRFKKEERRASAAAGGGNASSASTMDHHQHQHQQQQQYYGYGAGTTASSTKMGCYSPAGEFRFIDDNVNDYDHHHHHQVSSDQGGISNFLSWRFNVTDRPALVHDFTR